MDRREYVPVEDVILEFEDWLCRDGRADRVTLAGSGEPTLHTRFGDVIDAVHERGSIPTALLSNGSLLHRPEVRAAAARSDLVKVSLSVWDAASLRGINRAHADLSVGGIVDGCRAFRAVYSGELWLEVFVLAGWNAERSAMERVAKLASSIRPDRIHLNTVARPPSEASARPVSHGVLMEFASYFDPVADVVAAFGSALAAGESASEAAVLAMLERRPCTAGDLAVVFGMQANEVASYIAQLLRKGAVVGERQGADTYYRAAGPGSVS